jgi:hypothetical protein
MARLHILIEAGSGFDYTFWDFQQWANNNSFSSAEIIPLDRPNSTAIAYR